MDVTLRLSGGGVVGERHANAGQLIILHHAKDDTHRRDHTGVRKKSKNGMTSWYFRTPIIEMAPGAIYPLYIQD